MRAAFLTLALIPIVASGEQDTGSDLGRLGDQAFGATQPAELLAAFKAIAAVDTNPARQILVDIFRDRGRLKLLDVQVPTPKGLAPSYLRQSRYLGHALDAAADLMPQAGEAFLLKDLAKDWGEITVMHKFPPEYEVSKARLLALGALRSPSKAVYEILASLLRSDDYRGEFSRRAILRLGDSQAASLLRSTARTEQPNAAQFEHLLLAQHARNKPAFFELLVEGYRISGDTRNAKLFVDAIISHGQVVNSFPADDTYIPAYSAIATANDQKRIADLIGSLLAKPGQRKLSEEEKAALEKLHDEILGLKLPKDALSEETTRKPAGR